MDFRLHTSTKYTATLEIKIVKIKVSLLEKGNRNETEGISFKMYR